MTIEPVDDAPRTSWQADRLAEEMQGWRARAQALQGEKAALETAADALEGRVRALEAADGTLRCV